VEQERKYRVSDVAELLESLREQSYCCVGDEVLEDRYFDTPSGDLGRNDFVLRIRRQGEKVFFAEKGPRFRRRDGEYDRVDLEVPLQDPAELVSLLERRFGVTWRLVRRRQTYIRPDSPEVVIDYLSQVGTFAELEGLSGMLESLASQLRGLGAQESRNYREIIVEWCRLAGLPAGDVYGLDERGPLLR
jgi:predicted adenylyl cyclase CyaB